LPARAQKFFKIQRSDFRGKKFGFCSGDAATTKSAGKNLKPDRRKILEKAKQELRIIFKKN